MKKEVQQSEPAAAFYARGITISKKVKYRFSADLQHGEAVRERMGRVPDHEDGMIAEDAEDGLQEARLVVGVEVRRGFVE